MLKFDLITATQILREIKKMLFLQILEVLNFDFSKLEQLLSPKFTFQSSESLKLPKMTFLDHLISPKLDFM